MDGNYVGKLFRDVGLIKQGHVRAEATRQLQYYVLKTDNKQWTFVVYVFSGQCTLDSL